MQQELLKWQFYHLCQMASDHYECEMTETVVEISSWAEAFLSSSFTML